jgi:hypothetical protein
MTMDFVRPDPFAWVLTPQDVGHYGRTEGDDKCRIPDCDTEHRLGVYFCRVPKSHVVAEKRSRWRIKARAKDNTKVNSQVVGQQKSARIRLAPCSDFVTTCKGD